MPACDEFAPLNGEVMVHTVVCDTQVLVGNGCICYFLGLSYFSCCYYIYSVFFYRNSTISALVIIAFHLRYYFFPEALQ